MYEDMKLKPFEVVQKIAKFIGVDADASLVQLVVDKTGFKNMKEDVSANYKWLEEKLLVPGSEGSYIRKGEIGDWKNHFTDEQNKQFDVLCREKMSGCGPVFKYGD